MATTNLNLDTISGGESQRNFPSVFNGNMEKIDSAVGAGFGSNRTVTSVANAEEESIAYVSNNNTHVAIPAGRFVYVRNHGSLTEGLYESKSAIAANGTLSTGNLTAVSTGGLNALREKSPELFEKNVRSVTTMAALATDISTYATGDIIVYSVSSAVASALCGTTVSLNCVAIIFKASSSNAYYSLFYRDTYATGNISLSNGAVDVKYASHHVSVLKQSTTSADVTVQSGTTTEICGIDLETGHYIIILSARWATNDTGRRHIVFSESSAGGRLNLASEVSMDAVSGSQTYQQLVVVYRADEDKTVHFVAYQNSGSALTLNPRYSVVRLR